LTAGFIDHCAATCNGSSIAAASKMFLSSFIVALSILIGD
jgi:hypothetical protein